MCLCWLALFLIFQYFHYKLNDWNAVSKNELESIINKLTESIKLKIWKQILLSGRPPDGPRSALLEEKETLNPINVKTFGFLNYNVKNFENNFLSTSLNLSRLCQVKTRLTWLSLCQFTKWYIFIINHHTYAIVKLHTTMLSAHLYFLLHCCDQKLSLFTEYSFTTLSFPFTSPSLLQPCLQSYHY